MYTLTAWTVVVLNLTYYYFHLKSDLNYHVQIILSLPENEQTHTHTHIANRLHYTAAKAARALSRRHRRKNFRLAAAAEKKFG